MALQLFDRVNVSATANTTVSFTLGSAVTGFQSFSVMTNGNTTYYGSSDGTNWEVGIGTYSSSGPTLTRTTVLSSSNGGAAVSTFGASLVVWIDYPSGQSIGASNNPGTTGNFLKSNGTGVAPTWASVSTYFTIFTHASTYVNVAISNGYFTIINHSGSTVNVPVY